MDDLEEPRSELSGRLHSQADASVSADQIDAPDRRPERSSRARGPRRPLLHRRESALRVIRDADRLVCFAARQVAGRGASSVAQHPSGEKEGSACPRSPRPTARRSSNKDWGSGQPIVFSRGWPLSADDWDTQMLFFLQHGYRVIAADRRGHGRSTQTSDGHDMDHYADDLAALTAHLDLKDAVHVGHSLAATPPAYGAFGGGVSAGCLVRPAR